MPGCARSTVPLPLGLEALPAAPLAVSGDGAAAPEDPDFRQLLNSLDIAPTSVEALVERTGLTPDVVSSMLLTLELQGHMETSPGGRYSRVNKRS